jgi:DNA-binding NtrC family response regulator
MAKTVVLIDDDADDLDIMKEAITRIDPALLCLSFIYSQEAVRVLSQDRLFVPDYIFIDINMPKKNGIECLIDLRTIKSLKEVKIIIYSTSLPLQMAKKLEAQGATFSFQKPYSLAEYCRILSTILKS